MSELQELLADAAALSPRDRVEWLVELGAELPERDSDDPWIVVRECQSPVQLAVGRDGDLARVAIRVPATAPLIRGVAALIVLGLDGADLAADDVRLPDDLVAELGLTAELSPLRTTGLRGLWSRVREGMLVDGTAATPANPG